MFSLPMGAK